MREDIGSIYDVSIEEMLKDKDSSFHIDNHLLFSLCREALYSIASSKAHCNKVLLPAYTCDTVIAPFRQLGWECYYYGVNKDLRIDIKSFILEYNNIKPSIIVVHPYYGMDLTQEEIDILRQAKDDGAEIIVDITQCIFSEQRIDFADYYVGSYRKWFPIPDGGFLYSNDNKTNNIASPQKENSVFTLTQMSAMILRRMYFETNDEQIKLLSRNLTKSADIYSEEKITPHLMSNISKNIIQDTDIELNKERRLTNYRFLFYNINQNNNITFVNNDLSLVKSAPLYFPIYVKDRDKLQKKLIEHHVYAPILWPIEDDNVIINSTIEEIYNTILAIPIDQRYNIDDMTKIAHIINN